MPTRLTLFNAGREPLHYEWSSRALEMSRELQSDSLSPGDSAVFFLPLYQPVRTYLFTSPGGRVNLHLLPGIDRRISWDGQRWGEDYPLYLPLRRLETALPMQGPATPYAGDWEAILGYYRPRERALLAYTDSLRRQEAVPAWLTDLLEAQVRLAVAAEIETIRGYRKMTDGTAPALPDSLREHFARLLADSSLVAAPAYQHLLLRHGFLESPGAPGDGEVIGTIERTQLHRILRQLPVTAEKRPDFLARFAERQYHDARTYGGKQELLDTVRAMLPPAYLAHLDEVRDSIERGRFTDPDWRAWLEMPLLDTAGHRVIPDRIYTGRPVLYKFWFPGCIPCRRQYPFERRLRKAFPRLRLIYLAYATPEETWRAYLDRHSTPADRQLYWHITAKGAAARRLVSSPRYMLLAASGALVCSSCPLPDDPALSAALSTLD